MDASNIGIEDSSHRPTRREAIMEEMKIRLEAAKEITAIFKMERYVYISCCGIAVLLLLFCAFQIIYDKQHNIATLGSLFGSGGLITYSTGRLIYMWNKIVEIVMIDNTGRGGGNNADR